MKYHEIFIIVNVLLSINHDTKKAVSLSFTIDWENFVIKVVLYRPMFMFTKDFSNIVFGTCTNCILVELVPGLVT